MIYQYRLKMLQNYNLKHKIKIFHAENSLNFINLDITHDLAYFNGNSALSHTSSIDQIIDPIRFDNWIL